MGSMDQNIVTPNKFKQRFGVPYTTGEYMQQIASLNPVD